MNEKTKESKFLDAINKYAEQQKYQITQEIETYKNEKIEQATEKGLQDAYDLIRDDITRRKSAIVNHLALEELKLRNDLFADRQAICDKVFDQARQKLIEFASAAEYLPFLDRSLRDISEKCGENTCKLRIAAADDDKRDLISRYLSNAEVSVDPTITLGGVKAYCPSLGILIDDTLDTRLEQQRSWFIENSGLKVV